MGVLIFEIFEDYRLPQSGGQFQTKISACSPLQAVIPHHNSQLPGISPNLRFYNTHSNPCG
jgi:hypothetical protein